MQLFDSVFGCRERRWFPDGAVRARPGKFDGHALCGGRQVPIRGTTVARDGLAFISPHELSETDLDLTFTLRRRSIPSRIRVDATDALQAPSRTLHRYFCSFVALADDDWEAVLRYVDNEPEPAQAAAATTADGGFGALPIAAQHGLVDYLVRMQRLDPPAPGTAPLIRLIGTRIVSEGGRTAQELVIHSRVKRDGTTCSYDTRFHVSDAGRIERIA